MLKKVATLCCSLLLASTVLTPAMADSGVEVGMKGMAKSYKAANQADDAAALKQALTQMREYAVKAQGEVPPDFKDQAADGPERKAYTEGMTKLIKQIDDAQALLDAGKLDEAKAATAAMKQTKSEYHTKLKV